MATHPSSSPKSAFPPRPPGTSNTVGSRNPAAAFPGPFSTRGTALDLNRIVQMGRSAGGQLALWVAARKRVPRSSPVYMTGPLQVRGAVSLAGIVDMRAFAEYDRQPCRERHIRVMGGTPDRQPARYAALSPAELLPRGVPQVVVWGSDDTVVPESSSKEL